MLCRIGGYHCCLKTEMGGVSVPACRPFYVCFCISSESCSISSTTFWYSPGECVFQRLPGDTTPPFSILNLPPLLPPFSHHNIVFISPLRLNPSLPVHCGKRHFENEIGYINSSAITLAIAFPLYSSSETWLTSTPRPHISHKTKRVYVNKWGRPCRRSLTGKSGVKGKRRRRRRITFLFIWSSRGRRFLLSSSGAGCKLELVGCNKWSLLSVGECSKTGFMTSIYSGSILICCVRGLPRRKCAGVWRVRQ